MLDCENKIPIVDATALFNLQDVRHCEAREKLKAGISMYGFLILRNSAVTAGMIADILDLYRKFFEQSFEQKRLVDMSGSWSNRGWCASRSEQVNGSCNPDYKESFDCGLELPLDDPLSAMRYYAPNRWPDIVDFEQTIRNYFTIASEVAELLLVAIAETLDRPSDHFSSAFKKPMSLLRGNYYPPRPEWASGDDYGIAPHTDYGCLTLLVSDGTPGLEIQIPNTDEWIPVNVSNGDCVINFGDMLQRWSGDTVTATRHRVQGPPTKRISCALFFNPTYDTNIEDARSNAEPLLAGDFLSKRYNETYLHIADGMVESDETAAERYSLTGTDNTADY